MVSIINTRMAPITTDRLRQKDTLPLPSGTVSNAQICRGTLGRNALPLPLVGEEERSFTPFQVCGVVAGDVTRSQSLKGEGDLKNLRLARPLRLAGVQRRTRAIRFRLRSTDRDGIRHHLLKMMHRCGPQKSRPPGSNRLARRTLWPHGHGS